MCINVKKQKKKEKEEDEEVINEINKSSTNVFLGELYYFLMSPNSWFGILIRLI